MATKVTGWGGEPPVREATLPNGVRVVTQSIAAVRSVALGFFIGAGSLYEPPAEAGLSHLIEHLLFRGTKSYGSLELDRLFDEVGSTTNAETDKEFTALTTQVLDSQLDRVLPALAEMVFVPTLEGFEEERAVILQELAAYEDDPQDQVFDRFAQALFEPHPLGRPVIGSRETIQALTPQALHRYRRQTYLPSRVVVAAAGSLDHDRFVARLEEVLGVGEALDGAAAAAPPPPPPARHHPRVQFQRKETEQYHLCLGGVGLSRNDPRRFALRVLEVILGATPSSRLFQEVRERRGLAYAIFTFSAFFGQTGEVGVYLGSAPEAVEEAVAVTLGELERIAASAPAAEELRRAKECAKSATALALESSGARMARLGQSLLLGGELLSLDELIERIEAVEAAEVEDLAAHLLSPARLSVAAIGPREEPLVRALEPLSLPLSLTA